MVWQFFQISWCSVSINLYAVQLSLARFADHGNGYTPVLCVLGAVGGLVTAAIRSSPDPLVGMAFGIFTNIIYGVSIVLGQFIWPAKAYWNYVRTPLLLFPCLFKFHLPCHFIWAHR